jgi:hypothetical protein
MRPLAAFMILAALSTLPACTLHHTFTRETIQAQLTSRFPVERAVGFWAVRVEDPVLSLDAGANRVGLTLAVTAAGLVPTGSGVAMRSVTGRAGVEGRIEYRSEQGAFYLLDPRVTRLSFSDVPLEVEVALKIAAEAALGVLLKERPVYVLDAKRSETEGQIKAHMSRVWVETDGVTVEYHP